MENKNLNHMAYKLLYFGFIAAPILAGLDKFFNLMTNWSVYLSPVVLKIFPVSAFVFMRAVGIVEIIAGILVAFKPRVGGVIVAAWLLGIIINLSTFPGYYDIALRDFGLALGALALSLLGADNCK